MGFLADIAGHGCCRTQLGQPYSQRKIQALVEKVCKMAGLRVRNPHDLHHAYALFFKWFAI